MKILTVLGFVATMAVSATASQASVVYADNVDSYTQGAGITDPNRLVQSNALGPADGKFLSLGLGGEAIFSFGSMFKATGALVEITFGNRETYLEQVEVYGGLGNVFTLLGTVTNSQVTNIFSFGGKFDQLKLVDISPAGKNRDGFDVDAISVVPVPVPAAGLMLLSAIGLVGVMRRRSA
jgi:hypothetical protein